MTIFVFPHVQTLFGCFLACVLRGWLILGPFSGRDIDQDYLESIGGEANVTPKIGDTVKTTQGETLTWNLYQSQGDIVDLLQAFGDHTNVMAYAFCYLQSKWGKDATISLGSNDGAAVWFNSTTSLVG